MLTEYAGLGHLFSEDMVKDWQEEINRFEGIHQEEVVL